MPNLAPITINDGTDDLVFNPRGIDQNGVASLVVSTGVPLGDKRLTVSRTRTNQGREKVVFKMTIPVVATATVDGVSRPTITKVAYGDLTFSFDGLSTTAERLAARSLMADMLSNASVAEIIDDLETLF